MLSGPTQRPLDPAETYFELVSRTWPMNSLCSIELNEVFTTEQVEGAWNRLASQVPIIGAHVERTSGHDAHMVFGSPREVLRIANYDDPATAFAGESQKVFELDSGPLARVALVQGSAGSTLLFSSHHSAMDGRSIAELALLFADLLVNDAEVRGNSLSLPTGRLQGDGIERSTGARHLADAVATAREMRGEDGYVAAASPIDWHDPLLDSPRDIAFDLFRLTEAETAGVVRWARSQQATVHGALSAAILRAATTVSPDLARVGLSTSVDLRSRFDSLGPEPIGQAAGVISASYETAGTTGAVARTISADIRRRFDRGEGELLFSLSGAGRFPVDDTADRVVRRWTEQSTPTLFLGNIGVVDVPAPDAVQRVFVGLAPIPSQVAYVAAATFRNRLSLSVGYDRNRLTIDPDEFASTIHEQVLELARSGDRSVSTR